MIGPSQDIDKAESLTLTRDVVEELTEKIADLERLSLRPLVLLYEEELRHFKAKMTFASAVPGEVCKKKVELWDDELADLSKFITELLKGAHEK